MGIGKAKELIFTAKICSGEEAKEIGLVEHAVPQNKNGDAAYLKALNIAKEIAEKVTLMIIGAGGIRGHILCQCTCECYRIAHPRYSGFLNH